MKRYTHPLGLLALGLALSSPAKAGTDVGVSVSVRQPGFYGRVVIGQDRPAPAVVYAQPVVVQQTPVAVVQQPIYLHVPPGHHRNWPRYCGRYRACGQPVYFVAAPTPVVVAPAHGGHRHGHGKWHHRDGHGHGGHHGHRGGHH